MVRYTGSYEGGNALVPALPRFLPPCATLLLAAPPGGFIQKMSPSHTHTSCPYHNGKVSTESSRVGLHYSNKAAAGSIV